MGAPVNADLWASFGGAEITQVALVAVLLAGLLTVVGIAGRQIALAVGLESHAASSASTGSRTRWVLGTAVVSLLWLGITGFVAASGLLRDYDAFPPPMLRVFVPGVVLVSVAAFTGFGARLVGGLGWGVLIGFQAFRIPTELMLSSLYQSGKLPIQMTFHGANFDMLSGLSAIVVAWLAARGKIGLRGILVWNVAGLLLLANIVTIAVLSMPGRLRVFMNEPVNSLVFGWPFIWLPAWLVLAALFGHLLVFRKLWAEHRAATPAARPAAAHPAHASRA